MWNLAMVFMYFPLWCVVCPLYFLLSHRYGLFTIHPDHSYDDTIVVLYRIYVLFTSHQQNSFSLSHICFGAVMAF
jgi:hypothetical protein